MKPSPEFEAEAFDPPTSPPPVRRRFTLGVVIEKWLFGYIVRTEQDWFPAKDWAEAEKIRDRERDRFEAECLALEAEQKTKPAN